MQPTGAYKSIVGNAARGPGRKTFCYDDLYRRNLFLEIDQTYSAVTTSVAGLADFTDVRLSQLPQPSKLFYEDWATAGDLGDGRLCPCNRLPCFGNVTNYVGLGSPPSEILTTNRAAG